MSISQKSNVARIVDDPADASAASHEGSAASDASASSTAEAAEVRTSPASTAPAAPAVAATPPVEKKRRSPILPIILVVALAGAGWYGYNWWTTGRFMVSTDDAYIGGDMAVISPKVTGYVAKVDVVANQHVKAGDVLLTLDAGDYQNALDQAQAQVDTEQLALKTIDAQIVGGQATLDQAKAQKVALEATVRGAQITQTRAVQLESKSAGTAANVDAANIALDQAKANLVAGDASISSAQANILLLEAQRRQAQGTLRTLELARDKAARDLSFTVLKAPYDGVVGNRSVQEGDYVSSTNRLMSIVPTSKLYIDANFKETQLQHIVPGSKVEVHVDAYGDTPITGTVESISPASGSVFSLLPPENATGNFTKVIQRVPVRIALPQDALDTGRLRAGLSVVVDVDTRTAPQQPNN